jgi:hypothetical protein
LTFMAQLLICAECGMKQLKKHTNAVYWHIVYAYLAC